MIQIPGSVSNIIHRIETAGFEAYAVGGCVRDSLLGRQPNDWDITTNALPSQIKKLFTHTIDTGIQHGTVTVMMNHVGYEVTTYRIDGEYEDSRHPKEVTFTSNLIEDLKRRDFTINAMAYNETQGLVDAFNGREDLNNRIIKAVGNPVERFTEDALRMMRAVRFSAQLGYLIEDSTKDAIKKLAPTLKKISAERIQVELVKLVTSPHPERMCTLYETGLTGVFMPQFDIVMKTNQNNPHHCYSVGMHIVHSMQQVRSDKILRLTMLFHDMGKPEMKTTDVEGIDHFHGHSAASELIAKNVLKELKFDNDTIHKVTKLVLNHDRDIIASAKYVRRVLNELGEELFLLLLEVKHADVMAQSEYKREEKLQELKELEQIYTEIKRNQDCFQLKDLAISGNDLIQLGIRPGPQIGEQLNSLLNLVLENPETNTKEKLMEVVSQSIF